LPLVLDTNIGRNLGTGQVRSRDFDLVRRAGISIHLTDTAAAELTLTLVQGRMSWEVWLRARKALAELLDSREPILLGGGASLLRAGLVPTTPPNVGSIDEGREIYKAVWLLLTTATSVPHLEALRVVPPGATASYRFEDVAKGLMSEKAWWVAHFAELGQKILEAEPRVREQVSRRGVFHEAVEAFWEAARDSIDNAIPGAVPPASIRLDAFLRVHALLLVRSLHVKRPYDPAKNANDALDHPLLRYLALPAAVCTSDGGIVADVEAARSWQRPWIVSPAELLNPDVVARVAELKWPAASASRGATD
jgi:hypothetical protein